MVYNEGAIEMKKVLLLSLVLFVAGLPSILAQNFAPAVQLKDTKANMYPMMKDQSYSTIINAAGSKAEMMKIIKDYLIEYELGDSTAISSVDFDESLSEITIPLCYTQAQTYGKGMMGAPLVSTPIIMQLDAFFAFNDEGQMMLTLTNFRGAVLCFVDDDHVINKHKLSRGTVSYGDYYNEYDKKITDEYTVELTLNTGIGRFLLASNGNGWDYVRNAHKQFLAKKKESFEMYKQAMEHGSTECVTEENIMNYKLAGYESTKLQETWREIAENYHSGNWVLGMNQYRWKNNFQDYFNMVFRDFANLLNGSIESVALDGEIVYEEFEGKVLPVDKKERKKWLKEGYSL